MLILFTPSKLIAEKKNYLDSVFIVSTKNQL